MGPANRPHKFKFFMFHGSCEYIWSPQGKFNKITQTQTCQGRAFLSKRNALSRSSWTWSHGEHGEHAERGKTAYLDVDDGAEPAEVLVEFGDVVQVSGNLSHLQLGVHVVVLLREAGLMLAVEVGPGGTDTHVYTGLYVQYVCVLACVCVCLYVCVSWHVCVRV